MLHVCAQMLLQVLVGILAWDICSMMHSVCASMMRATEGASVAHAMAWSSLSLERLPKACPQDALGLVLYWRAQLGMLCQVCHHRICRDTASVLNAYTPLRQAGRARRAAHSRPGRRRKLKPTLPLLGSTLSAVWACR